MTALEIPVRAPEARYRVRVEPGLLRRAGREVEALKPGRIFIITQDRVWRHWGPTLEKGLGKLRAPVITIPEGEEHKNLATVEHIAGELVRAGADRGALLIAVGGGVVGDVAGFAAAVYLRGVSYVNVPTTLLAMVDSCVGGKTGVNLEAGKNLVGAFHHPRRVLVDPTVLETLPERELRAGLFEAIKCGIIRSRPLFDFLERRHQQVLSKDLPSLTRVIHDCLAIKAKVVAADEKEGDLRRILNFGHTVGHALEAETGYRYFLHGEAVAWGMRAATLMAEKMSMIRGAEAARIHSLTMSYGPVPPLDGLKLADILSRLPADKKTRQGVVHFVLPERIGRVRVVAGVDNAIVENALAAIFKS